MLIFFFRWFFFILLPFHLVDFLFCFSFSNCCCIWSVRIMIDFFLVQCMGQLLGILLHGTYWWKGWTHPIPTTPPTPKQFNGTKRKTKYDKFITSVQSNLNFYTNWSELVLIKYTIFYKLSDLLTKMELLSSELMGNTKRGTKNVFSFRNVCCSFQNLLESKKHFWWLKWIQRKTICRRVLIITQYWQCMAIKSRLGNNNNKKTAS